MHLHTRIGILSPDRMNEKSAPGFLLLFLLLWISRSSAWEGLCVTPNEDLIIIPRVASLSQKAECSCIPAEVFFPRSFILSREPLLLLLQKLGFVTVHMFSSRTHAGTQARRHIHIIALVTMSQETTTKKLRERAQQERVM